jgi:hypothetical protein
MHKPTDIKGYRALTPDEVAAMNVIKAKGAEVGKLIDSLLASELDLDPRWAAIAKTDLQKGFMSLTRAVAKPDFF